MLEELSGLSTLRVASAGSPRRERAERLLASGGPSAMFGRLQTCRPNPQTRTDFYLDLKSHRSARQAGDPKATRLGGGRPEAALRGAPALVVLAGPLAIQFVPGLARRGARARRSTPSGRAELWLGPRGEYLRRLLRLDDAAERWRSGTGIRSSLPRLCAVQVP